MSNQSRLSANLKGDNEMIPVAVHRSPGVCLMTEETPGKPQLGVRLMKAVRPFIASNGVSYTQMRSVRSYSTSGRVKVGKKEWTSHLSHMYCDLSSI